MLDKFEMSWFKLHSLDEYYKNFIKDKDQPSAIEETLREFFKETLQGKYTYLEPQQVPNTNPTQIVIKIFKLGIQQKDAIGNITLEFPEDSEEAVSMISSSNSVVSEIMRHSDSKEISQKIAEDDDFLTLGQHCEKFHATWRTLGKKELGDNLSLLDMNVFGKITNEVNSADDLNNLIYGVVRSLELEKYEAEKREEWQNRSKIINIFTDYISTSKIDPKKLEELRVAASKLIGANDYNIRKWIFRGVVGTAVVFVVGLIVGISGQPVVAGAVAGIDLVLMTGGVTHLVWGKRADLPSRAVLFLADKIELFSQDDKLAQNDDETLELSEQQAEQKKLIDYQPSVLPSVSEGSQSASEKRDAEKQVFPTAVISNNSL